MIYPTPAECLPKATAKGKTTITASNLKPNTKYSVAYKYDNTIRCIKDPCPENGFVSDTTTFTTLSTDTTTPSSERIAKRLGFGSWGTEVSLLQKVLVQKGFMTGSTTGYFGIKTMRAVKTFQASSGIPQTGFVGPRTQTALNAILAGTPVARGEKFSGTVEEVSTACFADGICSITVSGKKVITTVGWRQAPALGSITGVPSIGDAEKCIGAKADVYAEKEGSDYTLYGDNTYYVRIIGCGLD
jgi:peptidoglycan hydrolase-like protein with peptidoglycan-binding domain